VNWNFCVSGSRGVSGVPSQDEMVALKIILEVEDSFGSRGELMRATG
jgi:hypothetical protein